MSELTMKMFAGQPIDADEIQDNISMFLFFAAKDIEYRKHATSSPKGFMETAQEAVKVYEVFKKKSILEEKYKQVLSSYNATFCLVIVVTKLAAKDISICDTVLNEIKDLIEEAYKCRLVAYLMHLVLPLASDIVFRHYPKISHALQMITIDCVKRTAYLDRRNDLKMYFLNSKLNFLSNLLVKMHSISSEKKNLQSLGDLLLKLDVVIFYPKIATSPSSDDNVKVIANSLLSTSDDFEKICDDYKGHFPIELNKANLEFWRGLAFQELSYCEKLPDKRMEMAMKSMDQWLPLLNRWPMKTDLAALGLPENCSAMIIFLSASDRNVYNYENIIEIKCSALKNIDKSNVKLAIQEINQLRHDLIMTMKFFVSFREMRPDMFKTDQLRRLYLTIAEHYRSIVLDNKQKQESNLANSIKYIRKHIAVDLENSASEEKIINMIDSFSFIRNYRV